MSFLFLHDQLLSASRKATLLALFGLFLLCSACVTRAPAPTDSAPPPPLEEHTPGEAKLAWYAFVARSAKVAETIGPFRLTASLRYTDESGSSTRISTLLWGNGNTADPHPLRLDLSAGIGTTVAAIREADRQFMAFVPDEKTVYVSEEGNRSLVSFGVPIPLTLADLTLLLTGRAGVLFLPPGVSADGPTPQFESITEKGVRFKLEKAPLAGILELERNGAPVSWQEMAEGGWLIAFENQEDNPLLPRRLKISHPKGYSAIIVMRELEKAGAPFTVTQLGLALPAGTARQRLASATQ